MSFFAKVIKWFAQSSMLEGARKDAVDAITQAGQQLVNATKDHAPDMLTQVEQDVTNAVTKAVAGALTRSK